MQQRLHARAHFPQKINMQPMLKLGNKQARTSKQTNKQNDNKKTAKKCLDVL
jgi:hypothetical protein